MSLPFVSCIMPTNNRRQFVPHAIRYFLRQEYPHKELLIVDDGTDSVADLVPPDDQIRYIRLNSRMKLGEKRNFCVRESRGDLVMHWDDDDWMAPHRIAYQVGELLANHAEVCGLREMFFCQPETGKCWLYKYPASAKPWLAGGSLLYTKKFFEQSPFPDVQVASDTQFIWSRNLNAYVVLPDHRFYVATVHGGNTSPKKMGNSYWQAIQPSMVEKIMGNDWPYFKEPSKNYPIHMVEKMEKPNGKSSGIYLGTAQVPQASTLPLQNTGKTKVAILITTFQRPETLRQTIEAIKKEEAVFDLSFFVFDDTIARNGKKNYWKTINTLWSRAYGQAFDFYIQLPDDMRLEEGFVGRCIKAWNRIDDPRKICLNLLLDGHRLGKTCWTNFWPQLHSFQGNRYLKTQWVDMFYICQRGFFEQLQWKVNPIPPERWAANPHLSSGVGQQLSLRLHAKGWNIYQTTEKLAEHIGDHSTMNTQIRIKEPLKSAMLPAIYAGMASIPKRERQLRAAIESMHPYLDVLFLYLNDYEQVPEWLRRFPKVRPFLSRLENSNMGDAGKFFGLNKADGEDFYYFSLDDDMVYPPDYVWRMIEKIEKFQRQAVVGCGGYSMKPQVRHFYADRSANWHISAPNTNDRPVHILHTCLTAWHCSTLRFRYESCRAANMGDVWLALAAQQQNVPMMLIERPPSWVKGQALPVSETIYGQYRNNCQPQTEVFNSWPNWQLLPMPMTGVLESACVG